MFEMSFSMTNKWPLYLMIDVQSLRASRYRVDFLYKFDFHCCSATWELLHVEFNSAETGCEPQKKEWIGSTRSTVSTLAIYISTRPNLSPSFRKGQDTIEQDTLRFGYLKSLFSLHVMLRSFWAPFNNSVHVDAWWWGIVVNWIGVHNFLGWFSYSVLFRYVEHPKTSCCVDWQLKYALAIICTPHCICCMEHKSVVPYSFKRVHFEENQCMVYGKGMEYRHWLRHTKFQSLG